MPKWDGEIWPGKPEIGGVVRTETDGTTRSMLASEERFRKGAWISYADLRKVFVIIQSCKQWKKGLPMMSSREALRRFGPIIEDMQRAALEEELEETSKDQDDLIFQISPGINETVLE